jgi:hypothetical protein
LKGTNICFVLNECITVVLRNAQFVKDGTNVQSDFCGVGVGVGAARSSASVEDIETVGWWRVL